MSESGESLVQGREISPAEQSDLLAALERAVRLRTGLRPRVGIVLGSGLGGLADAVDVEATIPFEELPGWPAATAPGHAGRLLFGHLAGMAVLVQQGRFHLYEGYSAGLVVQPVLLMRRLGAEIVVLTNAAGGVNPDFGAGTLMIIADHLNLTGRHPLIGPNDDEVGPRFPDMTEVWDSELRARLRAAGKAEDVALPEGVYACLTGPSYETPAEVRMLRTLGADAVGMSTVPEVIVGVHAGLRILGVSIITDLCIPEELKPVNIQEIIAVARQAEPRMAALLRGFLRKATL